MVIPCDHDVLWPMGQSNARRRVVSEVIDHIGALRVVHMPTYLHVMSNRTDVLRLRWRQLCGYKFAMSVYIMRPHLARRNRWFTERSLSLPSLPICDKPR